MISPTVVLTAAHCDPMWYVGQSVLVGAHKARSETSGAEYIKVIDAIEHEDYASNANYKEDPSWWEKNDIGLLRLEKPYYLPANFKLNIPQKNN